MDEMDDEFESAKKRMRRRPGNDDNNDGDTTLNDNTGANQRDYYDQIMQGHVNDANRFTWLVDKFEMKHDPQQQQQQQQFHFSTTMEESIFLKGAINSVTRQLSQTKRRLWPTAERCVATKHENQQDQKIKSIRNVFETARSHCNPLECLGEGRNGGLNRNLFMNRSAIKLANIDAALGFSLVQPVDVGAVQSMDLGPFMFVDLCGAPGGFSEYLLHRCKNFGVSACRGYGMSLQGTNEHGNGIRWKLEHMSAIQQAGFDVQYRISKGMDGTGDIYKWENVVALQQEIQNDPTNATTAPAPANNKVHLVLADGGFDAQRDSEYQEHLAQKIIVCQVSAALLLLRPGGTFIIKMFGFQTDVSRGVMRYLCATFQRMMIMKPVSSRPASLERYVVCTGFLGTPPDWDGPKWRDQMFLGAWSASAGSSAPRTQTDACIDNYMDVFDRDLLTLNSKACFTILTTLERQAAAVTSGPNVNVHHYHHQPEMPSVNVNMYRRAWRLN